MNSVPWRSLFLASLAINIAGAGAIVGRGISERRHAYEKAAEAVVGAPNVRGLLGSLPPERAADVRDELAQAMLNSRDKRKAARKARQDLMAAAQVEPFNEAAVTAAFADMRSRDSEVSAALHAATVSALAAMTPEERQAALRGLARPYQRFGAAQRKRRAADEAGSELPPQP